MDKDELVKNVEEYVSNNKHTPLEFLDYNSPVKIKLELENTPSIESMITRVLELSCEYYSVGINGNPETSSNRFRSSLDIWRHIIYYYPQVTIFQVMKGLWDMKDSLVGHYCPDVRRRVFKLKKSCSSNIHLYYGPGSLHISDEYHSDFPDWENL